MGVDPAAFACGGYFVSRSVDASDGSGTRLPEVTLAASHTRRRFFPQAWTLSWTSVADDERRAEAAHLGLGGVDRAVLERWADAAFEREFGAWSCFYTLGAAREAVRRFGLGGVEVWGAGLPPGVVADFLRRHTPPAPVPGFAPEGAGGTVQTLGRGQLLEPGGTVLGFEPLHYEACAFESAGSLHRPSSAEGLLPALEPALAACRELGAGWFPWLLVAYRVG